MLITLLAAVKKRRIFTSNSVNYGFISVVNADKVERQTTAVLKSCISFMPHLNKVRFTMTK